MKRSLFFLATFIGLSQAALADSDGYFCISDSYVAYELRGWSVPENKHLLRVVRVGGKEGIAEPVSAVLDDFQLHGMKCEDDRITLLGWDRKYTVDLMDGEGLKVGPVQPVEAGKVSADFQVKSFLHAGTSVIDIPSASADRRYELHIQNQEESYPGPGHGGIIHHKKAAKIVEKDLSGRIMREREVYQGVRKETVD